MEALRESQRKGQKVYAKRHPEVMTRHWKLRYERIKADPERRAKRNAQCRAFRERHPERRQQESRRIRYGLAPDEFDALMRAQDGRCAICQKAIPTDPLEQIAKREPQVDHNHDNGRVRGLLCRRCNTRLGVLEGSESEWIDRALAYITGGEEVDFSA